MVQTKYMQFRPDPIFLQGSCEQAVLLAPPGKSGPDCPQPTDRRPLAGGGFKLKLLSKMLSGTKGQTPRVSCARSLMAGLGIFKSDVLKP